MDIERRRARAREYLRTNHEYRQKAQERAREASDRRAMADPETRGRLEIYNQLVEMQGGEFCAICLAARDPSKRRLSIDHDHETDEIRGLLCSPCNRAVGSTRQAVGWLRNAIDYLDRPKYSGLNYSDVRAANLKLFAGLKKKR